MPPGQRLPVAELVPDSGKVSGYYPVVTREHSTRLSELMEQARLTDPALAELAGTSKQQVFKLRKGDRKMSKEWADRLAPHLGIEWAELMQAPSGGAPVGSAAPSRPRRSPSFRPDNLIPIPDYDIRPQALLDAQPPEDPRSYQSFGEWTLPVDALPDGKNVDPVIVKVIGDAMEPDYAPGSRVMVDLSVRRPVGAGIYLLWDGASLVFRQVEQLIGSSPLSARISSINPRYASYERPVEDVAVAGRVVGRWLWK